MRAKELLFGTTLADSVLALLFAHRIGDSAVARKALSNIKSRVPKIAELQKWVEILGGGLFNSEVGQDLVRPRRDHLI